MIKLKCKLCNSDFEKLESEYKRQSSKGRKYFFCSLKCSTTFQRNIENIKIREEYDLNPSKCIKCEKILSFEQRMYMTCGHSCGTKFAHESKNFSKKYVKHGKFKIKPCMLCGSNTKRIFCSKKCSGIYKRNKTLNKLKNKEYVGKDISLNSIRHALILDRGHKCEDCKNKKWKDSPINLTLHHMDGDACNNTIENLQLLCWNCHSMTPNYGNKNNHQSTRKYRHKS